MLRHTSLQNVSQKYLPYSDGSKQKSMKRSNNIFPKIYVICAKLISS